MRGYFQKKKLSILMSLILLLIAATVMAKPGDPDKGTEIYNKRCIWCHGEDGDGLGPAADRLNPPPMDFSEGWYKFKTTAFDDDIPNDEDIYRAIRDGMPNTAMPGWADILSEQEMWDLVAYVKIFAGLEEEEPTIQLDYGTQIPSSEKSIGKGKDLFLDRCIECHGETGKGVAIKRLKDDLGYRTWPRNLTKPWTFRGGSEPKDIFTRITVGMPGTQMPSFADPDSKKMLTIKERWHVANYVLSLAEKEKIVSGENTVVKATKIDGLLPESPDDPKWTEAEASTFLLVPQLIGKERFFTPLNDTISARALYNDKAISILLEWDDRTKSIPGDDKARKISDPDLSEDGIAIQLPTSLPDDPGDPVKPYFGMGDETHPVTVWWWKSGTTDAPESTNLLNSKGFADIEKRDPRKVGLKTKGIYDNGTWRVVMKRPLATQDAAKDLQIEEGRFIPVAFAAWDGSNSEKGPRHTMTSWYWLYLKPSSGAGVYIIPLVVILLVFGGELWWARSVARKKRTL